MTSYLSYSTILNYLSLEIWLASIIQTLGKSRKSLAFIEPNYPYRIYKSHSVNPILIHTNAVNIVRACCFKIQFYFVISLFVEVKVKVSHNKPK